MVVWRQKQLCSQSYSSCDYLVLYSQSISYLWHWFFSLLIQTHLKLPQVLSYQSQVRFFGQVPLQVHHCIHHLLVFVQVVLSNPSSSVPVGMHVANRHKLSPQLNPQKGEYLGSSDKRRVHRTFKQENSVHKTLWQENRVHEILTKDPTSKNQATWPNSSNTFELCR